MGLTPDRSGFWAHLPTLAGADPLILDQTDAFEDGEGIRATLFPHHLLIEVRTDGGEGHLLLSVTEILEAIALLNKQGGS